MDKTDWQSLSIHEKLSILLEQVEWIVFVAIKNGIVIGERSMDAVLESRRAVSGCSWKEAIEVAEENAWDALNNSRFELPRNEIDKEFLLHVCWSIAIDMRWLYEQDTAQKLSGDYVASTYLHTEEERNQSPLARCLDRSGIE